MPAIQQIGPASTSLLYLENEYQRSIQRATDWEKNLQRQGLDPDAYANEIQQMQTQIDEQAAEFESKKQMMLQSQKFVDLGIISPEDSQEAMWAQVLPRELHQKMYPKEATDPQRAPFSPNQIGNYQDTVEEFTKSGKSKRYGKITGFDWTAKDVHTQGSMLNQYNKWKTYIGYDAMTFSQQGQVDSEWDSWAKTKNLAWNPETKAVKAARGRGPLTNGYGGSKTRNTPLGPREAGDPLQSSIAKLLPKKKVLTQDVVRSLLLETNNDPAEARRLAKERGYTQ